MSGRQNLNRTVKKSIFGGLICGVGGTIGGLIGGPIGIGIGSAVGGLISSRLFSFQSTPDVVQNDLTPNDRQELMARGRQAVIGAKEFIVRIVLQLLSQLRDCKTFEDFRCRVLLPMLEELIGLGVGHLIKMLFAAV